MEPGEAPEMRGALACLTFLLAGVDRFADIGHDEAAYRGMCPPPLFFLYDAVKSGEVALLETCIRRLKYKPPSARRLYQRVPHNDFKLIKGNRGEFASPIMTAYPGTGHEATLAAMQREIDALVGWGRYHPDIPTEADPSVQVMAAAAPATKLELLVSKLAAGRAASPLFVGTVAPPPIRPKHRRKATPHQQYLSPRGAPLPEGFEEPFYQPEANVVIVYPKSVEEEAEEAAAAKAEAEEAAETAANIAKLRGAIPQFEALTGTGGSSSGSGEEEEEESDDDSEEFVAPPKKKTVKAPRAATAETMSAPTKAKVPRAKPTVKVPKSKPSVAAAEEASVMGPPVSTKGVKRAPNGKPKAPSTRRIVQVPSVVSVSIPEAMDMATQAQGSLELGPTDPTPSGPLMANVAQTKRCLEVPWFFLPSTELKADGQYPTSSDQTEAEKKMTKVMREMHGITDKAPLTWTTPASRVSLPTVDLAAADRFSLIEGEPKLLRWYSGFDHTTTLELYPTHPTVSKKCNVFIACNASMIVYSRNFWVRTDKLRYVSSVGVESKLWYPFMMAKMKPSKHIPHIYQAMFKAPGAGLKSAPLFDATVTVMSPLGQKPLVATELQVDSAALIKCMVRVVSRCHGVGLIMGRLNPHNLWVNAFNGGNSFYVFDVQQQCMENHCRSVDVFSYAGTPTKRAVPVPPELARQHGRPTYPDHSPADVFGLGMFFKWFLPMEAVSEETWTLFVAMTNPQPTQRPTLQQVRKHLGVMDEAPHVPLDLGFEGPIKLSSKKSSWNYDGAVGRIVA